MTTKNSQHRERKREYDREWKAARRSKWLEVHGPCSRCSSWRKLEIHHLDPNSKVSHKVWSWKPEKMEAELAKCEVLCKPCHQQETSRRRRENTPHGSLHKYRVHKCRCEKCSETYREYVKLELFKKSIKDTISVAMDSLERNVSGTRPPDDGRIALELKDNNGFGSGGSRNIVTS